MIQKYMNSKKKELQFIDSYLSDFSNKIKPNKDIVDKLYKVKNIILNTSKRKGKLLLFGYERWVEKTIEFYGDSKDTVILISSSGKSPNMINACKAAKSKKISKIITLTGHNKNNPLSKLGDINYWKKRVFA